MEYHRSKIYSTPRCFKVYNRKTVKFTNKYEIPEGAGYLLDSEGPIKTKILSNMAKQKHKEKAGKWSVPMPKVKPMINEKMLQVAKFNTN